MKPAIHIGAGGDLVRLWSGWRNRLHLTAHAEGRKCVVALSARASKEVEREVIEHLIDTVEVDRDRAPESRSEDLLGTGERASGGKTAICARQTAGAGGAATGTIVRAWTRCPGGRSSDVSGGA